MDADMAEQPANSDMDANPGQFMVELKFAILRRRVGQIALAVVMAEEKFHSSAPWCGIS